MLFLSTNVPLNFVMPKYIKFPLSLIPRLNTSFTLGRHVQLKIMPIPSFKTKCYQILVSKPLLYKTPNKALSCLVFLPLSQIRFKFCLTHSAPNPLTTSYILLCIFFLTKLLLLEIKKPSGKATELYTISPETNKGGPDF